MFVVFYVFGGLCVFSCATAFLRLMGPLVGTAEALWLFLIGLFFMAIGEICRLLTVISGKLSRKSH